MKHFNRYITLSMLCLWKKAKCLGVTSDVFFSFLVVRTSNTSMRSSPGLLLHGAVASQTMRNTFQMGNLRRCGDVIIDIPAKKKRAVSINMFSFCRPFFCLGWQASESEECVEDDPVIQVPSRVPLSERLRGVKAPRTYKYGRCPSHGALRPHIWKSGVKAGQAALVCNKFFDRNSAGQPKCWYFQKVSSSVVDTWNRFHRQTYYSLQNRLKRAGRWFLVHQRCVSEQWHMTYAAPQAKKDLLVFRCLFEPTNLFLEWMFFPKFLQFFKLTVRSTAGDMESKGWATRRRFNNLRLISYAGLIILGSCWLLLTQKQCCLWILFYVKKTVK